MARSHLEQRSSLQLRHISIAKCELLVSIHAYVQVFLASDKAPISLPAFRRQSVLTTAGQLLTDVSFHYGTGALYSAGMQLLALLFSE